MKRVAIIIILILSLTNCSDKPYPYKDLKLPKTNDYYQIVIAILKQDTTFINPDFLKSGYISSDLTKLKIRLTPRKHDTTSVAIFCPQVISTSLLELLYYNITNSANRSVDSLYFSFQNDSTKQIFIDSMAINFIKLATKEIKIKNEKNKYFGYFQFSVPILNKNMTKAFVEADFICSGLCGQGVTCILEKINNEWKLTLVKIRWEG